MRVMRKGTAPVSAKSSVIFELSLLRPGTAPMMATSPCSLLKTSLLGVGGAQKSACCTKTRHAYCTAKCLRKVQSLSLDGICARM